MNRRLSVLAVLVFATLAQPRPAEAKFWAWLEEWSGPGPFKAGKFGTILGGFCMQEGRHRPSPLAIGNTFHQTLKRVSQSAARQDAQTSVTLKRLLANPSLAANGIRTLYTWESTATPVTRQMGIDQRRTRLQQLDDALREDVSGLNRALAFAKTDYGEGHSDPNLACWYIDQGFFTAEANPERGFPALKASLTDLGTFVRLHDGLDIGGGFGVVRFTGDTIGPINQWSLTPLRIVLRPALMAVPDHLRKKWMGVFTIYWKETYVKGELLGEQFGAPPGTEGNEWRVNGEMIRSFGLNLDLTALFTRDWTYRRPRP